MKRRLMLKRLLTTFTAGFITPAFAQSNLPQKGSQNCKSVAELRTCAASMQNQQIELTEHTTGTGVGGGYLYADLADKTSPDNDVTIFVGSNGVRWKRAITGGIQAEWGGVHIDENVMVDQSIQLQKVVNVAEDGLVLLPPGPFKASISVTSNAVSFIGILGKTKWYPRASDSLIPCIEYKAVAKQRFREIRDIEFISGNSKKGIAIYYNAISNLRLTSCRFSQFLYSIYCNSSEWNRIDNCRFYGNKYGIYITGENPDILNSIPAIKQSATPQYIENCSFQGTDVPFVLNEVIFTHEASSQLNILNTECLDYKVGLYVTNTRSPLFRPLNLTNVWFEKGSLYTGEIDIKGTKIPMSSMYIDNATVNIIGGNVDQNHQFKNSSRIRLIGCSISSNFEKNSDLSAIISILNSTTDGMGGLLLKSTLSYGTLPGGPGRNLMAQCTPKIPVISPASYPRKNLFGKLGLCDGSELPGKIGNAKIEIINDDGFYRNKSLEIIAPSTNDGINIEFSSITIGKWYVLTLALKCINNSVSIKSGEGNIAINGSLDNNGWKTFKILSLATETVSPGNIKFVGEQSGSVFRLSLIQLIEFETANEALLFSDGNIFSMNF